MLGYPPTPKVWVNQGGGGRGPPQPPLQPPKRLHTPRSYTLAGGGPRAYRRIQRATWSKWCTPRPPDTHTHLCGLLHQILSLSLPGRHPTNILYPAQPFKCADFWVFTMHFASPSGMFHHGED